MLRNLFLSSLVALGFLASPAQSCSVHDQMCQFHGVGRAVNHTINQNSPTSVVIGTIGNNAIDFDNAILLPDGNGPYIASSLPIFDTNQPYLGANEQPRRVATGQYQVDFQNGTAQATHSGDFNGAAAIPNPPGCTIGTGSYCEEIRIIGNIPDPGTPEGFVVKQTNYLYNYYNTPNPSIDLVSYGAATGRAYFKQNSHLGSPIITDPNEYTTQYSGLRQEFLAGNKATGAEQTYYIGYDDFDAHAAGVVVHYDQTRTVRSNVYDVQFGHQIPDGTTQFSGLQRKNTIARFDRTYDFTKLSFADTGLPALQLNDQETARWNTWSDVYGVKENAGYTDYVLTEQKRIKSEMRLASLQATNDFCSQPNGVCANNLQSPNYAFAPSLELTGSLATTGAGALVDGSQNYIKLDNAGIGDTILGGIHSAQNELDRQGTDIAIRAMNAEGFGKVGPYIDLAFHSIGTSATNMFFLAPAAGITNCSDFSCSGYDMIEVAGVIPVAKLLKLGKLFKYSDNVADLTSVSDDVGILNKPNFIVTPGGDVFPVPSGAIGPSPVINSYGRTTGQAYTGGNGGLNGQVAEMRIMDSVPARGNSPAYPNGYIKYENATGQGVNPYSGQTLSNSESHFFIKD